MEKNQQIKSIQTNSFEEVNEKRNMAANVKVNVKKYGGFAKQNVQRVCLLYSGGLDTSCMLSWIQEEYGADIVTFTADLGQDIMDSHRFQEIEEKAKKAGAVATYTVDLKEEFATNYLTKVIKANGFYQGNYPLSTTVGRYLIAKKAVEIAKWEGCDAIAHGSTGMGNDQVRLDVTIKALAPELTILRPMIDWGMGRDIELQYAADHGIEISDQNKKYSTDENLWGRSCECDVIEIPEQIPPSDSLEWLETAEKWPKTPEIIKIGFQEGIPVSIDDKEYDLLSLIGLIHKLGVKHGIGWIQAMEDRVVGLKSRETYEIPAASIIMPAHKALELFVTTRHENSFKNLVDQKWIEMVYEGLWVDPLVDALNVFIDEVNSKVSGWVKVRLYKGKAEVVAQHSPYALYDKQLVTYDNSGTFKQSDSYGFIELHGLSSRMGFRIKKRLQNDNFKQKHSF